MSDASKDRPDRDDPDRDDAERGERGEHLDPEPLEAERPAATLEDVIEVFDREPPEEPVTDADAPPPFG